MSEQKSSLANGARGLAWLCVLATVVAVPALTTNPTILGIGSLPLTVDQVELPKAVALAVLTWLGLTAWGVAEVASPKGVRWSNAWWILGAFLGLVSLSAVLSPQPRLAYVGRWFHYEGLLQLWVYAAACFVAAQTVNERRLVTLVRLGALTGAVLAVYGIMQALRLDPATWLSVDFPLQRSFSTWNNPDFFGGYLLFPLSFAVAVAASDANRWWRLAGVGALGLVGTALVTTLTRGAWLAGLLVAVIMLSLLLRRGIAGKRTIAAAVMALVVAVSAASLANGGALLRRALGAFSSADIGVGGRLEIWSATIPFALDKPLLGTGPDTFWATMLGHAARQGVLATDDPHNVILYLLVTVGLPATVAVLGFVGVVLARSARLAFSREETPAGVALAAIWCATIAYSAYLLLNVSIVASTTMLFVCLGLLLASTGRKVALPRLGAGAIAVFSTALVIVSVVLGVRGLAADHAYFRARLAAREGGDRAGWAARAVELNPLNEFYERELEAAERAQQ